MSKSSNSFVHLHTHTEYSMLDGAARVSQLVSAAVEDSQPALGITDHGNMYGVLDFYKECRNQGINPVIGLEAYMAADSRFERPVRKGRSDESPDGSEGDKLYYHLILLAETNEGYKNLMKLSSQAYLEGYYYKPRVDWELLERYSKGIIATSGCLGGVVLQALLRNDLKTATKLAAKFQEIFGRDNFFIELQDHGLEKQRITNPALIEIAKKINAPLLATNDSHYTKKEDAVAHDALLCVQTGASISDPKRFRFESSEHYLKSAQEMRYLFRDYPQACDATLEIAQRAQVEIEFGKPRLPRFEVPKEYINLLPKTTPTDEADSAEKEFDKANEQGDEFLRYLTYQGAKQRYGDDLGEQVVQRLDYELEIISNMGFSNYFLVVWDLIRFAKKSKIRVGPGRGSAAGCCVAYCLNIVDLDPIKYDLLFERFLNPGRKQMPDIDMDFDERYRSEMIRYAAQRYGIDHVAQIVTFSTIKARAAVRDAARVLGLPYMVGDKVAKAMPPVVMGRDTPLWACMEESPGFEDGYKAASELRQMYELDPDVKKTIDVARGLEGLRRQDGIHAAAVVITDEPLTNYLPIQRKPEPGGRPEDAPMVTQYEMHGVEELGLLKMDFLGLRNLSVIERALELIEKTHGKKVDIDNVSLEDESTFEMLRKGHSIGVFQLEGGPMRSLMRSLAPTSFDDIAALVALYRPGPMAANMHNDYADRKNGRQEIKYLHPDLEAILGDTYGLMIYQESVMRVAQRFAGYSLEEADNLRKACGKKIRALIALEREKFVSGCEKNGYGATLGHTLFDIIEPFADYAFNKSHSYGYGYVSYQTAWLKANYPVEYLAAILTSVKDDKDKAAVYLAECRRLGIEVLVPDVNRSLGIFSAVYPHNSSKGAILFGLAAIRNVGEGLVSFIVQEREERGVFKDFYDFCERVNPSVLNKRTVEALIKAGAFDSMGYTRQGLYEVFEKILEYTLARRREKELGVLSLFGDSSIDSSSSGFDDSKMSIPEIEFDKHHRLALEKEMLGLYVSDHPLMGAEAILRKKTDCSIEELKYLPTSTEGETRLVGGVVVNLNRRYTKRGDLMATFTLEDLQSSIEVLVFPKAFTKCSTLLQDDAIVCVKAKLDSRDDEPKLICLEVVPIEIDTTNSTPVRIKVPPFWNDKELNELKNLLLEHPGNSPIFLEVGQKVLGLPSEFNVDSKSSLLGSLRVLLGSNAVSV